ncbi:TITAN-like protein isoform X3 [Daucus carota subsp. sativus]|uniref:TITAN-like protein isoform X3 n=1 Tax=Daucus carota subsp. sativus TaxID=79200 RepID=UPI0030839683
MNPRIHHRNAAPVKMKKKVKEEKNEYELCKVCKINHNLGRRHNFYPNHIKSLSSFLSRFQTKLSDVRFFLKNPTILLPEHAARNRLWCVFCDFELDEIDSSFACANAINHLASADHLKSVKDFLWRYGGGMDRIDSFRIVELDLAKWEKKCKLLNEAANNGSQRLLTGPVNDIHNELNSENFYNCDRNTIHNLNSSFTNGVVPLQNHTLEEYQVSGIAEFDGHVHGANSCTSTSSGTQFGYMDNQHASILNGRIGSHPNGGGYLPLGLFLVKSCTADLIQLGLVFYNPIMFLCVYTLFCLYLLDFKLVSCNILGKKLLFDFCKAFNFIDVDETGNPT